MLHLFAVFERKVNRFPASDCEIEKIMELTDEEYLSFRSHLLKDTDFIAENKKLMYSDENRVQHCLLVLGQSGTEGILIQSEGYDYARYASLLPGAKDFVVTRLNELADLIIREGTQNTESGSWAVAFEELKDEYHITVDSTNSIGSMLLDILASRPEMAGIELVEDGFDMSFYLDYCPNVNEEEKLASGIPDNVLRLKELIRIPIENFHLVHHEIDIEPVTIVYLDSEMLTDAEKTEWGDVLNARVMRVFHGIYGIQIECDGVSPQRLNDFSLMLAGYCHCEDYEHWIRDEPDSSCMKMKL